MFKADGAIGGTVQKVGGPFANDGVGCLSLIAHSFVLSR
jgi:formyltetrahydrofolate synthetase